MRVVINFICSLFLLTTARADLPELYRVEEFPGKIKILVDLDMSMGRPLDILFIVDNSGSMESHQTNLARNISLLVDELKNVNAHLQAGVLTTDMLSTRGAGRLIGEPTFLTSHDTDFAHKLEHRLLVGTRGSGTEQPLKAMYAALTEPLKSGYNRGFLREDALLAVVFLTDAADQSQLTAEGAIQFLQKLKGDIGMVLTNGLLVPSGVTDCSRDQPNKEPKKLEQIISHFRGGVYNLCDKDFGKNVRSIGQHLADAVGEVAPVPKTPISRIPLPMEPVFSSIEVTYGSQRIESGHITKGWIYDVNANAVLLGSEIPWTIQAPETPLEVLFVPQDWAGEEE